jgi:hypothetical protein
MENPQIIACPKETWTKVATEVTTGIITKDKWVNTADKKRSLELSYWATYRVTGDPAPSANNSNEGDVIGEVGADISATEPIDVYIYCTGEDGSIKISL